MRFHGPCFLDVLFSAGLEVPGGLPDIARRAAWTCDEVHQAAFEHLFDRGLERWERSLQLSEGHDDLNWGIALV